MNEKPEWELLDDNPQPKQQSNRQQFSQRDFLYSLLGNYPRLKLAGLATAAALIFALVAVFSLIALAGAAIAGAVVLFIAWCRAKFFKHSKSYQVHIFGK